MPEANVLSGSRSDAFISGSMENYARDVAHTVILNNWWSVETQAILNFLRHHVNIKLIDFV